MEDFDRARYTALLVDACPAVIETPEEHERLLALAEAMMERGPEQLSIEETKLLELLVVLIHRFEQEVDQAEAEEDDDAEEYPLPKPHETLQRLLGKREWDPSMLNDIFGNPRTAHDVLAGRRPISKGQAKQLGELFQVPPKLFIAE